jgi:hypothetical protein
MVLGCDKGELRGLATFENRTSKNEIRKSRCCKLAEFPLSSLAQRHQGLVLKEFAIRIRGF